mmetsp:Transcript_123389/g.356672  ORF Transcript_123389/g.356672 Transcript_123389/m.356672 type:complete len:286 (+) Transcript_123389:87-944(+)
MAPASVLVGQEEAQPKEAASVVANENKQACGLEAWQAHGKQALTQGEPVRGDGELDCKDRAARAPRDFRLRYIARLVHAKVWVPFKQRPPAHQTVTIFDWDDTLLCTSWLIEHTSKAKTFDSSTQALLRSIERCAFKMLSTALCMGHTVIITNAVNGWVEQSASMWAPGLLPLLDKVPIISARDSYQEAYPEDVSKWKVEAFLGLQRELPATQVANLIAIGDSEFEMAAARLMRQQYEHALLKTVKFIASPSPVVLLKQMEVVTEHLGKMIAATKSARAVLNRKS